MSRFLFKQGQFLLKNDAYAFMLAGVFACIPFLTWVSSVILALVTLVKGRYQGFKVLIISLTMAIITASYSMSLPYAIVLMISTFLMVYAAACLLRTFANWSFVVMLILSAALIGITLIHWLMPAYIASQYQMLLDLFRHIEQGQFILAALESEQGIRSALLANYLLGVKASMMVFSALISLMFARYIQSLIVYPGGFKKELLAFKASRLGLLSLLITVIGVYNNAALAISYLPLLVIYLMMAGICLFYNVMPKKNDWLTLLIVLLPMIIAPYIMLLVYVFFGSLDSLFNVRVRLLASKGSNE